MALLERARSLFSRRFKVQGSSMEPAFAEGSSIEIDPFAYVSKSPQRGDVVALRAPLAPERLELKRIIGLPGDRMSWLGTGIRINHQLIDEPYARPSSPVPGDTEETLILGPCEYFVAGDNRLYSHDSRMYGPVSIVEILGKAV
jgi:signal peptidase I